MSQERYSVQEAVGRPISILVPDDKKNEVGQASDRLSAGKPFTLETVRVTKKGDRVPVSIAAAPVQTSGGQIVGFSAIVRDIRERIQHQEQMQTVMHELSHRAKNVMAVISAIANQMGRNCETIEQFQARFNDRIRAFAASHDALVERNWSGVPMYELVRVQLAPFHEIDGVRVSATGPDVELNAKAAEQLGLCLHELATNAIKHGSLSLHTGRVTIEWAVEMDKKTQEECFTLLWRERGGPPVSKPIGTGFGSLILQRLAAAALNGKASKDFAPEGITWKLSCPAAQALRREGPADTPASATSISAIRAEAGAPVAKVANLF